MLRRSFAKAEDSKGYVRVHNESTRNRPLRFKLQASQIHGLGAKGVAQRGGVWAVHAGAAWVGSLALHAWSTPGSKPLALIQEYPPKYL